MREELVNLILKRLDRDAARIAADFAAEKDIKTRFCMIDDLLPADLAQKIADAFPSTSEMRLMKSFRELKYNSKSLDKFDPLVADITFAFQNERIIDKIAKLTGIKDPHGDPHLYAGGLSAMTQGHFLNPHIDNSHDGEQKNYRVLNLLYYITPDWRAENRGNFWLWGARGTNTHWIPSLLNLPGLVSGHTPTSHSAYEGDGQRGPP